MGPCFEERQINVSFVFPRHTLFTAGTWCARNLPSRMGVGPVRRQSAYRQNSAEERCFNVQVLVRDNNVDQALKALKKKMQREGVFREMKLRRNYEKPSERKARERAEAVRRARKLERKRLEREGF